MAVYTGKITTEPPEQDQFVYGIIHNRQHIWYVFHLLLVHMHQHYYYFYLELLYSITIYRQSNQNNYITIGMLQIELLHDVCNVAIGYARANA